jgi:hypothetical protein
MKRLTGWQFSRAEGGGWSWSHFDEKTSALVIQADQKFPSLSECVNDAAKHGYHTKARGRVNHRGGPPA